MTVKRKRALYRHPDSNKLAVVGDEVEVDLSGDISAEAWEAHLRLIYWASPEGQEELNKRVREKTAEYAALGIQHQAGTRKPRLPEINKWIDKALDAMPDATRGELWERAPAWIEDLIGKGSFLKRVSKVRKVRASRK